MKKFILGIALLAAASAMKAQTTTIISAATGGGFELGGTFALNNWVEVQAGTATANKWYVGTATVNAGTRAAYISNNGGTSNAYTVTQARVQHFYRDITFPAGQPYITLTFNWKGVGESCCDYMNVFLVPTSTTPVAGTMLASGQIGSTYNSQTTWQTASITIPCSAAGTTQRLVFSWRCDGSIGTQPPNAIDNISLISTATAPTCTSLLGTGVVNVASLPYTSTGRTTCGKVDDLTSANVFTCGATWYFTGEDEVFIFTPAASGSITISITSSGSYTGMMLYDNCPMSSLCSASSANCVGYAQDYTGSKSMCVTVTAGVTYYLIIDSYASPTCNPYDITISAPSGTPAGTICSNAPSISLPYSATGHTTACYGNDYTNASTGSCGSLYESGEDRVYALTVASSTCISISLTNASTSSIGYQVYSGCPGVAGTTCIANDGGSANLSGSVVLPAAGTYYIIVDTWASPSSANYDIAITSMGSGPVNDLPCNASALLLNVNLSGNNSCSGSASEPAAATCWTTGNLNTVWYTVVCPASGQLKIRTTLGTLNNTQIAVYSGTCGSLTQVGCNDDAPACGSSSYYNSELSLTGLTPGATYYIRVDGANNATGTFDILAIDGATSYPPAAGQECSVPNPVCTQTISVGNPGYQAYGNVCDFPGGGTNCLASGERGSAWYTIPISANGILEFDIVPNDWPGAPSTVCTDYDFAVWKVAGAGATTCAGIAAGATPIRCNYSGLGVTGLFSATTGTAPAAYPGFGGAYEQQLTVTAGEVYVLVVSNFSNSTSGFTLTFSGASPINYTGSPSSVTWSGGTNTTWTLSSNWGGCAAPTCGINAVITPASANQPVLNAGTFNVNSLTINAGASLTLNAGAVLNVCGDFTNSGSLIANAGATIVFNNGAVVQNINGALVGADKFPSLVVTKTGGSVILNANIDIGGSFTTSNNTSIFNTTGKYIKIAGNFTNANGNSTFTNVTGGTLEFNGSAAQTYNQGASTLSLNNVLMNHTGTGVTCATNMVIGTAGILTLTLGKLITNANEVQVTNTASAACTAGNTNSFVQGNLRRFLAGTALSYDFPVGHATQGYQRANITFTTATTIPQLLAFFTPWSTVPLGPAASECPTNTYNVLNALNNGYWTITASSNATSGNYDVSLYNTNYTNSAGASGWTVMKAATIAGPWGLNGTCVATSTPPLTQRTGLNGFSVFATAQSVTPLPIELLNFTGRSMGNYNRLEWTTASEINNDMFVVQRSDNGQPFEDIGVVDGAGNSTALINYHFDDLHPAIGTNYYRLRQIDFNGDSHTSHLITIQTNASADPFVENVHPNPTTGNVFFDYTSPDKTTIHIVITDMFGRIVRDENLDVNAGRNSLKTVIDDMSGGVYTLSISDSMTGYQSINRIVKQ